MYRISVQRKETNMQIVALNNRYNDEEQILEYIAPYGLFAGCKFDAAYELSQDDQEKESEIMVNHKNEDIELLQLVKSNDVIITSTLTNFSLDFIEALKVVAGFDAKRVRVIAYQEKFDSTYPSEKILIKSLPMMIMFQKNVLKGRQENNSMNDFTKEE